jgi:hypothetical protein
MRRPVGPNAMVGEGDQRDGFWAVGGHPQIRTQPREGRDLPPSAAGKSIVRLAGVAWRDLRLKPIGDSARKGAVKKRTQLKTRLGGVTACTERSTTSGYSNFVGNRENSPQFPCHPLAMVELPP